MDDKLVTNGTELPAGSEIPVETWLPFITEFVNQRYNNVLKNLQIPEFIRIIATLEVNHWLVFLFLFTIIIICYLIFIKTNRKAKLKSKSLYIQLDSIYDNYYSRGWLILILVFSFVHYVYYINNHELIYFKSISLSFLIMYAFLVFPYSARLLSVRKWKKTTLNLFKSSSDTVFEDYKTQDKQYKWKNKSAEKSYLLFLEKILKSKKILEKELDHYKKGPHKDKVSEIHLDQVKTEIIQVDIKEGSVSSTEPRKVKVIDSSRPITAKNISFLIVIIIACTVAWKMGGGWLWLFAFLAVATAQVMILGEDLFPGFTKAEQIFSLISTIIVCSVAWKAGGWWWFLAFLVVGWVFNNIANKMVPKEDKEVLDTTDELPSEDIKSKTPALSALAEQKITNPSVPVLQNDSNNKTEPKSKEISPAFGIGTFIAFAIAFFAGGFWWVLAIGMGLAWLGKKNENKEEAKVQVATPDINTNVPTNNLSDWAKQLTNICAQYNGNDYYVAELIPAQKLENAMQKYPIPNDSLVIALIDATVFGSADNGMLIGEKGISWHNGFSTKSRFTSMKWAYFSAQNVSHDNTNIMIGAENLFNMSGCSFDKNKIIDLFKAIQQAYLLQEKSQQLTQANDFSKYVSNQQKHGLVSTGTWIERLTKVCLGYSSDGFYVGELLPQDKLQYAIKEYPTPDNGKIVALIDTSAFGSIQGMAIGEHGVSWHNRSAYGYSSFRWKDFSEKVISQEGEHLKIGKGAIFNLIGDSQQNKTLVAFLKNIQHIYLERENEYKQPEDIIDQVLFQDSSHQKDRKIPRDIPRKSESVKVTDNLIDLNTADLDTLLALPGIGVAEAKSLIKQRDVAGPFTSTKQVFDFLKLKPHHANKWKASVVINEIISPQTSTTTATPNPDIHRPLGGRMID